MRLGPVLVAVGWVLMVGLAFSPGFVSTDTLQQFAQGKSGQYSNLHPPLYSWLLGATGSIGWLFWGQLVLLAGGLLAVGLHASSGWRRMVWLVGALSIPPVWALAPTLWKDVLFVGVGLWAVVALLHRRHSVAAAALLVLPCLRHNALFAVVPLALLILLRVEGTRARLIWAAVFVVVLFAAPRAIERLTGATDVWPGGQLYVFALAAMEREGAVLPAEVRQAGSRYDAHAVTPLIGVPDGERYSVDYLSANRAVVEAAAYGAIADDPLSFLRHRWEVSRHVFGIDGEPVCEPFHMAIDSNPWGWAFIHQAPVRSWLLDVGATLANSVLFRGWWWLSLAALLLIIGLVRKDPDSVAVAASAVSYSLSFTLAAPTCDFRYQFWVVVAVLVGLVIARGRTSRGGVTPAQR